MTYWKIVLEYDGMDFAGWQVQNDEPTIQQSVQDALESLLGHSAHVTGSGRTDSDVHALGQVGSFHTEVLRTAEQIRDGLNSYLPEGICCIDATSVSSEFHPRHTPHKKHYRYRFLNRKMRSPLRERQVWRVSRALDVDKMNQAAQYLQGTHDFSSFRASGCGATHTTRTLESATVTRIEDEVHLDVWGKGFLRHMVRIMAGTLLEVGLGRAEPAWVQQVLIEKSREAGGITAPGHGLTLMEVQYEEEALTS